MNMQVTRLTVLIMLGGIIAGSQAGCVAASTYEQVARNAELQRQSDQRQIQDLTVSNRQLKQRLEELESSLRSAREQIVRTEKEWRETRDELLKMKIEKEQQRGRTRDRLSQLERPEADLDNRLRFQERADEAMRRIKELMRQLQVALDQYSGRDPL
ncbi:MAG: hypothetical protein C4293_14335 [Nitrospiraceae bacterium]